MEHMFQKRIDYEIILKLINKDSHLRALSKELDIPITTLFRKMNPLVDANVLVAKSEGRNKVFSLRDSVEAKSMVFISEHYKFLKLIHEYPVLKLIFRDVLKESTSDVIILFGSYAKFNANEHSDIDIFILSMDKSEKKKIEMVNTKIKVNISSELNEENLLVQEIVKDHVIIKGVEKYYEKKRIFS